MGERQKTCIVISGPTAVGKTAVSLFLADYFKAPILSFDSRQCYRELNIGVAKPSQAELKAVPHYFINSHSIFNELNAADFARYAENTAKEIFTSTDLMVMVGGTGLYLNAFLNGMDEIPPIDPDIRNRLRGLYEEQGMDWLKESLQIEDPSYAQLSNPQRMLRALEVKLSTGHSLAYYQQAAQKSNDFTVIKIALDLDRETLYHRINLRVDKMMEDGLEREVRSLIPHKNLNALNTVGYKELFEFFQGTEGLAGAVANIKQHTRNYAKRQLTWFRRDQEYHWFHPEMQDSIKNYCLQEINK